MCKLLLEILESVNQPITRFMFAIAMLKLIDQGCYTNSYSYSFYNSNSSSHSYFSKFSELYNFILKNLEFDKSTDISPMLATNPQ